MAIAINGSGTITGISAGGLPDDTVDNGTMADDAIDSAEIANGAVDLAHLSATGTASSSTFLRGDNAWATPTAPTGWERVTRSTGLSGDQDIETTALFDGTYNQIMICVESAVVSADNTDVALRYKIGGSYLTSDYKLRGQKFASDTDNITLNRSNGAATISSLAGIGNASGEYISGKIFINTPSSTSLYKIAEIEWRGIGNGNEIIHYRGVGTNTGSTGALQGVRIYGNYNGNLGTSTISTYGLKL